MTNLAHAWRHEAACQGMVTELFFGNDKRQNWDVPRAICQPCPVRQACLADALRTEPTVGYIHGMRGGLTPAERAALAKRLVKR